MVEMTGVWIVWQGEIATVFPGSSDGETRARWYLDQLRDDEGGTHLVFIPWESSSLGEWVGPADMGPRIGNDGEWVGPPTPSDISQSEMERRLDQVYSTYRREG